MRRYMGIVLAALAVSLSGCSALTAYAKGQIRQQAYLAADEVVDRVVTRMDEKLDLSDETEKEVREAGKAIAREEIDKLLSDDKLDEAAASEEPAEEKEEPDAPDAADPAAADPAPEPH
jgi:hypothetical protein